MSASSPFALHPRKPAFLIQGPHIIYLDVGASTLAGDHTNVVMKDATRVSRTRRCWPNIWKARMDQRPASGPKSNGVLSRLPGPRSSCHHHRYLHWRPLVPNVTWHLYLRAYLRQSHRLTPFPMNRSLDTMSAHRFHQLAKSLHQQQHHLQLDLSIILVVLPSLTSSSKWSATLQSFPSYFLLLSFSLSLYLSLFLFSFVSSASFFLFFSFIYSSISPTYFLWRLQKLPLCLMLFLIMFMLNDLISPPCCLCT